MICRPQQHRCAANHRSHERDNNADVEDRIKGEKIEPHSARNQGGQGNDHQRRQPSGDIEIVL